ncbi:MAG TPA: histidine kinase [Bacteroidetes bacterium]|nr:histidine kinase [Bacteroidota bacterium]HRR07206.1 CBS domain-containing protein [Rhodothermales bacterium]
MHTVADILKRKGSNIYSVTPDTLIRDVLHLMNDKNIGAVVVMEKEQYLGIFTERVYARRVVIKGKSSNKNKVGEVMATDFPRVRKKDKLNQCMQLMTTNNIRYLPVFEEDSFVGIISIIDVVMEELEMQKELVEHMQNYISG